MCVRSEWFKFKHMLRRVRFWFDNWVATCFLRVVEWCCGASWRQLPEKVQNVMFYLTHLPISDPLTCDWRQSGIIYSV